MAGSRVDRVLNSLLFCGQTECRDQVLRQSALSQDLVGEAVF